MKAKCPFTSITIIIFYKQFMPNEINSAVTHIYKKMLLITVYMYHKIYFIVEIIFGLKKDSDMVYITDTCIFTVSA